MAQSLFTTVLVDYRRRHHVLFLASLRDTPNRGFWFSRFRFYKKEEHTCCILYPGCSYWRWSAGTKLGFHYYLYLYLYLSYFQSIQKSHRCIALMTVTRCWTSHPFLPYHSTSNCNSVATHIDCWQLCSLLAMSCYTIVGCCDDKDLFFCRSIVQVNVTEVNSSIWINVSLNLSCADR